MKYHSVLDLHTHTIVSGHAYCTLREMAKGGVGKRAGTAGNHRACTEDAGYLPQVLF